MSSTSVTTNASGQCTSAQWYYTYGDIRTPAPNVPCSGTLPTDFTFTGQRRDASAGLMYYNARYYDSALGRFISADTIVPNLFNPQHLNRFTYVYNNPVKYTDPSGHEPPWDDFWAWAQQRFQTLITLLQQPLRQAYDSACGSTISDSCGVQPKALSTSDVLKSVRKAANQPTFGDPVNPEISTGFDRAMNAAQALEHVRNRGRWIDHNESMSEEALEYQHFISGRTDDLVFEVGGYTFDDFDETQGILKDAKAIPDQFVDSKSHRFKPWVSGTETWLQQAQNQVRAARGVRIVWYFKSQEARDAMYNLFHEKDPNLLDSVDLVYEPIP